MHCENDNDNKFAKYYTCSLLNTLQSRNVGLVEKNVNQILETISWKTWLKRYWLSLWISWIIESLKIRSFFRLLGCYISYHLNKVCGFGRVFNFPAVKQFFEKSSTLKAILGALDDVIGRICWHIFLKLLSQDSGFRMCN